MAEQTKTCTKCDQQKPISNFYKDSGTKDGYYWCCKSCKADYQKKYRKRYRQSEKAKEYDKKYSQSEKGKETQRRYLQSEKGKETRKRYNQSEKGKEVRRKIRKKFNQSEKGKEALKKYVNKYRQSGKGKKFRKKYEQSEKGKKFRKKYSQSEKGEEVRRKAQKKYHEKDATYETYAHQIAYAEEVRRHSQNAELLQVKCTYCGKWYSPTLRSLISRITVLQRRIGGGSRLYCSDNCKKECPTFGKSLYPRGFKKASSREVQPELRQMVFERDAWKCQRCDSDTYLHCHHITGIEQNPIESADLDNCITFCKKCHKWVHSQAGCRYVDLQREKCGETFETPREELMVLVKEEIETVHTFNRGG